MHLLKMLNYWMIANHYYIFSLFSLCLALLGKSTHSQKQQLQLEEVKLQSCLPREIATHTQPLPKWWGPQQQSWNPSMN
jgi:hypothetical protein